MIKKVLIVDDDSASQYMLETLLKGYGLEVISATNGEDALDKARLSPPDLIVTDILMPGMDGFTLCRQWKSDDTLRHIPLIFYTATYTEAKDEAFALSLGAERFVVKPQEPEVLMNIINEVMEKEYQVKQPVTKPLGEEMEFFRQYNEILFKKLEKKMLDLEIANKKYKILEEQYRLSFKNVTDVIYTIDTDLNIISMSPSVEKLLGYQPQNFIGRPVSGLGDILAPESIEQAIANIILILKGEAIPVTTYRFITKDGTIKYGEVSGSPLVREGKIIGMIAVARDITERKRAEEELRESEKKYRELYDFLPIPVYEMDMEGRITAVNRAIFEVFRGTEEDLKKGIKVWQLLSPEDVIKSNENIQRLIKGEQIKGTEYTLMRLDGSVFPAIIISSVIYSNGIPVGLRGAIIDITERKLAEEELLKTLRQLKEAKDMLVQSEKLAAIGRLSAGVGHEILNPLNVISMRIQLLEMMEEIPDKVREGFAQMRRQIDRIVKITKDLSQFSRIGKREMVRRDISEVTRHILDLVIPRLKLEGVALETVFQPELPPVLMEPDRIEQVVLNIINNAMDAMEESEHKAIEIKTGMADKKGSPYAWIIISDNGKGIPPGDVNILFDPFFTTKEAGKGTGLGLYICYNIIQDHGGRIWAENNAEGGASFFIELPINQKESKE